MLEMCACSCWASSAYITSTQSTLKKAKNQIQLRSLIWMILRVGNYKNSSIYFIGTDYLLRPIERVNRKIKFTLSSQTSTSRVSRWLRNIVTPCSRKPISYYNSVRNSNLKSQKMELSPIPSCWFCTKWQKI